jgi:hypothetical protein
LTEPKNRKFMDGKIMKQKLMLLYYRWFYSKVIH